MILLSLKLILLGLFLFTQFKLISLLHSVDLSLKEGLSERCSRKLWDDLSLDDSVHFDVVFKSIKVLLIILFFFHKLFFPFYLHCIIVILILFPELYSTLILGMLLDSLDFRPHLAIYLGWCQYLVGWVRYISYEFLCPLSDPDIWMTSKT